MGEQLRFEVRRETLDERIEGGLDWLVVDTAHNEIVARFSRRTNWINGRPHGPEAAARATAADLNAQVERDA